MKNQTQARPDVPPGEARGGTVLGAGCFQLCCPRVLLRSPSSPLPALPVELAKSLELESSLMCFYGEPTVMGPRSRGTSAETVPIPMPKYSCTLLKQASNLLPTYCTPRKVFGCVRAAYFPGIARRAAPTSPLTQPPSRCAEAFICCRGFAALQLERSCGSCQVGFASH